MTWKVVLFKILDILMWVVLISWVVMVIVDFVRVRGKNEPYFCWFNKHTTTYENGTVDECMGIGYKVINYNREDFKAVEFGPFWISDRTAK